MNNSLSGIIIQRFGYPRTGHLVTLPRVIPECASCHPAFSGRTTVKDSCALMFCTFTHVSPPKRVLGFQPFQTAMRSLRSVLPSLLTCVDRLSSAVFLWLCGVLFYKYTTMYSL